MTSTWKIADHDQRNPQPPYLITDGEYIIAEIIGGDADALATARKMAAAERMLAAAEAVVDRWDTPLCKDLPHTATYINQLRAVIREARGLRKYTVGVPKIGGGYDYHEEWR